MLVNLHTFVELISVTMTPGWPCNKPDLTIKGTTLYSAPMTPRKYGPHTNIHDPLHVYSNRELPLTQLPVDNTIDTLQVITISVL